MIAIKFTVYGNPKGLKRHRVRRIKDKIHSFDPSSGDKADFLGAVQQHRPPKPIGGPVYMYLTSYHKRPKAHYVSGKPERGLKDNAPVFYDKTPDCDNVFKFVADAMNGIFWIDDKLIVAGSIVQFYDDTPRLVIKTGEMDILGDLPHG